MSDPAVSASFQIQPSPLTYSLDLSEIGSVPSAANDFSYTITNTSDQPVTFNLSPADFVVTGQNGAGAAIWESDPGAASQPATSETLQPGQSVTETANWAQMAYDGSSSVFGDIATFTVSVLGAPATLTSNFNFISPFAFSPPFTAVTVTGGTTDANGDVTDPSRAPLVLTLTETNITSEPMTFLNDADNFNVTEEWNGTPSYTIAATGASSNDQLVTLQPGQSLTLTATWDPDANPNSPAPDGYYQIGFDDPFDIFSGPLITVGNPPPPSLITVPPNQPVAIVTPITAPSTLTAPAPASSGPIAVTASASQVASHPNAPLRISLTLDNVLDQKVHLGQFKKRAEITLLRGSTVVAAVRKRLTISRAENLKPGRSVHLSTDLKIKPTRASSWVLAPGTYTVEVEDGGYSATTTLDIGRS